MPKIDLTDVQEGFEPAPPGSYLLACTAVEEKEGPAGTYANWTFQIVGGDHDSKKIWHITSYVRQAQFGLKHLLGAFGEDVSGEVDFEPTDYIGRQVWGEVIQQEYKPDPTDLDPNPETVTTNKIKKFAPE